jgi:hypothetical protein
MKYGSYIKYVNDRCFEVLKEIKASNLIIPKRHPNKMDKELIGLWVHHLGGNHVLSLRSEEHSSFRRSNS